MSVPRASVLDYSRELCTTASHTDSDILPFGDMNALDNPDPDLACRISCFTIGIILKETIGLVLSNFSCKRDKCATHSGCLFVCSIKTKEPLD